MRVSASRGRESVLGHVMQVQFNRHDSYQMRQFDIAFTCIMRLSSVYDHKREIDIFSIRSGDEALPSVYGRLIATLGGLGNVVAKFCPLNRTEATEWLIRWCVDNKVAPHTFALAGTLGIGQKRAYTVHYEVKDKDAA